MDPTLKTRTLADLRAAVPTLPPRLRTVAKYIIDHPSDFGLDPIRETARKSGVSTYTLVRMAKTLGFDSYDSLREPFRHALVSATELVERPAWIDGLHAKGALGEVQAEASLNGMAIVARSLERQADGTLETVARLLLDARHVYLTGVRATYGLAYYFHYVGRMALPSMHLIPRHMSSAIDELNEAGPGDVMIAITFTPYSPETVEACKFAAKKGVTLVMISDSDVVSTAFQPAATLVTSTLSTHHFGCFTGAMAVIEALLALLVRLGGDTARRRIASYEALRKANNAYWLS